MSRIKLFLGALLALTSLLPSFAISASIDPAISIVGSIVLDDDDPDLLIDNTYTASIYSTVGGVVAGAPVTNVALTDTGDGYGHFATMSGNSEGHPTLGADYTIAASNSSADTYLLTFGIEFSHSADADDGGVDDDARADSRLEVEEVGVMPDHLFSKLSSESGEDYFNAGNPSWQDAITDETSVVDQGTWGALLQFGETRYFTVELVGGASADLTAEFTIDGDVFEDAASYEMTSDMFIFLDSFENLSIPEPTSGLLLLIGLLCLGAMRTGTRRLA